MSLEGVYMDRPVRLGWLCWCWVVRWRREHPAWPHPPQNPPREHSHGQGSGILCPFLSVVGSVRVPGDSPQVVPAADFEVFWVLAHPGRWRPCGASQSGQSRAAAQPTKTTKNDRTKWQAGWG